MAENNPFAGLVTPDMLEAQRLAQRQAQYQNAPIYTQIAAQGGAQLKDALRSRGIGLTTEDIKAQKTDEIMKSAQQQWASAVKEGKMSAEDAQINALETAVGEFAKIGNWEAAVSLTQPLNTLQKQKLERRKLSAEATFQEARPDIETAKADATLQRAQVAQELADLKAARAQARDPSEIAKIDAQTQLLQAQMLKLLNDIANPKSTSDKRTATEIKEEIKADERLKGAAAAATLFNTIKKQAIETPGALTQAGALATEIQNWSWSYRSFLNPDAAKYDEDRVKAKIPKLARSNVLMQSAIIDLAFAFARIRDPGGRLSNQDVDNAIKIVTGAGSPQDRLAVLDQAFEGMNVNVQRDILVDRKRGREPIPELLADYEQQVENYRKMALGPAVGGTGVPDSVRKQELLKQVLGQ